MHVSVAMTDYERERERVYVLFLVWLGTVLIALFVLAGSFGPCKLQKQIHAFDSFSFYKSTKYQLQLDLNTFVGNY